MKKGVILAGGNGTRLLPFTEITNKHLALVYKKLMIEYPLSTLQGAGIEDILVVSSGKHMSDVKKFLGDGSKFGVNLEYKIQKEAGGIAQALGLAKKLADGNNIAVILGDNYFEDNFKEEFEEFNGGARIFLKEVEHPERFGVPEMKSGKIIKIIEKPKKPETKLAVTGLYLYDNEVFEIIEKLSPSIKGEFYLTDVNNYYAKKKRLDYSIVSGYWDDMGEPDTLLKTANYIAGKEKR